MLISVMWTIFKIRKSTEIMHVIHKTVTLVVDLWISSFSCTTSVSIRIWRIVHICEWPRSRIWRIMHNNYYIRYNTLYFHTHTVHAWYCFLSSSFLSKFITAFQHLWISYSYIFMHTTEDFRDYLIMHGRLACVFSIAVLSYSQTTL